MSQLKYLVTFNNTLKQFISQLRILFPNVEVFETADNLFHAGLVISKDTYIKEFYENVYKNHYTELTNQNTDFFLALTDFDIFPETKILRSLYPALTEQNKITCWKYVSILTKMAGKYFVV